MIRALSRRLRGAAFSLAVVGVSVAASGQCYAQSPVVVHSGTHELLRQQLAVQKQTLTALQVLQGQIASLTRIEQRQGESVPTAAPLSLAGCLASGTIYRKGSKLYLSPNRKEECVDAVPGKPAYGLAWHLIPEDAAK